jgi:glutathione S-transferase
MKLMYTPQSPFARKVRVAADELGLDGDIELIVQAVAPTKENPDYAAKVNPLRKIPALVLDDGRVIYDSTVICEYFDDLAGGGQIIPAPGPDRWDVLTTHALAQGMMEAAVLARGLSLARLRRRPMGPYRVRARLVRCQCQGSWRTA